MGSGPQKLLAESNHIFLTDRQNSKNVFPKQDTQTEAYCSDSVCLSCFFLLSLLSLLFFLLF